MISGRVTRAAILAPLTLSCISGSTGASSDAFQSSARFALTGNDNTEIKIIDRADRPADSRLQRNVNILYTS
jgi:hypothetical protein